MTEFSHHAGWGHVDEHHGLRHGDMLGRSEVLNHIGRGSAADVVSAKVRALEDDTIRVVALKLFEREDQAMREWRASDALWSLAQESGPDSDLLRFLALIPRTVVTRVVCARTNKTYFEVQLPYLGYDAAEMTALQTSHHVSGRVRLDDLCFALSHIARATGALFKNGISHRDVKFSNVLTDARLGVYRLADFGLLARMDEVTHGGRDGTISVRSPESHVKGGRITGAEDMTALLLSAVSVLSRGGLPYQNLVDDRAKHLVRIRWRGNAWEERGAVAYEAAVLLAKRELLNNFAAAVAKMSLQPDCDADAVQILGGRRIVVHTDDSNALRSLSATRNAMQLRAHAV